MKFLKAALLTLALALPAKAQTSCTPTLGIEGKPCIGQMMDFVVCSNPGCGVCLLISLTQGPFQFGGYTFNIGMPAYPLLETVLTQRCSFIWLTIPNDPNLVGITIYYLIFGYSPVPPIVLEFGPSGSFTICP